MEVEVEDGLLGAGAAVHDGAEVGVAELTHDLGGDEVEVANERLFGGGQVVDRGDRLTGDDQDVDGGGGLDVVDDDALVVLELDFRRNLFRDDLGEEGFAHRMALLACGSLLVACCQAGYVACQPSIRAGNASRAVGY